jgi:hypothetical protein
MALFFLSTEIADIITFRLADGTDLAIEPVASGGGGGITQLTGNVLAGPGAGAQAAVVVGIDGGGGGSVAMGPGAFFNYAPGQSFLVDVNGAFVVNATDALFSIDAPAAGGAVNIAAASDFLNLGGTGPSGPTVVSFPTEPAPTGLLAPLQVNDAGRVSVGPITVLSQVLMDLNTPNNAFNNFLSTPITPTTSKLKIEWNYNGTMAGAGGPYTTYVRATIGGVPVPNAGGWSTNSPGDALSIGNAIIVDVVPGVTITVALQWKVDLGGTAHLDAATDPDTAGCNMILTG